jgi:hypothetical protein
MLTSDTTPCCNDRLGTRGTPPATLMKGKDRAIGCVGDRRVEQWGKKASITVGG